MKKTKVEVTTPQLVYVVQNYERELVSVNSTLKAALETYKDVLTHGLSAEDREMLTQEYGENFHDEIEYPPQVIVYELDGFHIWSYDTLSEIKHALEEGEDYS